MTHPFAKLLNTALRKSTATDNVVLEEAEMLKSKGYDAAEIHEVLLKIQKGLLNDVDAEIVREAAEQIERYL